MENKQFHFSRTRFFIILFLIIIGIALCLDLTYIFYKANFLEVAMPSFCSVNELIDCDGVAKTVYSVTLGVPNSIWGLILYSIILMLLFVDRIQNRFPNSIFKVFKNPRSYIATLGLVSFLLSMILAFISIKLIHKICYLCFCTYFIDILVAFCAKTKGFFFEDIKNTVVDFIEGAKQYFILFIIVSITFFATLIYLSDSMVLSPKLKKQREMKEFLKATNNKYAIKGNVLGKEKAKVKINVYSDFNCPFCKVVNIMVHKAAKTGKIHVEEIHFPLDRTCNSKIGMTLNGHENSCEYAKYALAAKKQGKYWGVADILFYKHPQTADELVEYAKKEHLNLNIEQFYKDVESKEVLDELYSDIEKTASMGITGTPVLEINGVSYVGAMPYDELMRRIDLAISKLENK